MSDIRYSFDWEDPGGARGAELRATWARLEVTVDGEIVTRLIDHRSRGVRDAVYLPLYPLAEWLATHWWSLLYEPEMPGRSTTETYDTRHNVHHAAEGFALPHLSVVPNGAAVLLRWEPAIRASRQVEFTGGGARFVPAEQFAEATGYFIDAVVRRLDEHGVRGTLLQHEWQHTRNADGDERDFCMAAASLGLDPYALDDASSAAVVAADSALPPALRSAFFAGADPVLLGAQVEAVLGALQNAGHHQRDRRFLNRLRAEVRAGAMATGRVNDHHGLAEPWAAGHALARQVRDILNFGGDPLPDGEALARRLGTNDPGGFQPDRVIPTASHAPFDALMAVDPDRGPGFVLSARGVQAQRFALCRALYEFLITPEDQPRLVTRARTASQQRNRAFAAEFLAPVAALRRRIVGPELFDEEAEEIASEFGVSPLVVRYQLENHGVVRSRTDGGRALAVDA